MIEIEPPTRQTPPLTPGERIRVTQQVFTRGQRWATMVEGTVVACRPEVTGSWYAHGKNDKLWLLRIRLRKADGELTTLVIDHNSVVERLEPAPPKES